jgi:hypothetical protein
MMTDKIGMVRCVSPLNPFYYTHTPDWEDNKGVGVLFLGPNEDRSLEITT